MTPLESARRIVEAEDEYNAAEKAYYAEPGSVDKMRSRDAAWETLKTLTQEHGPSVARALLVAIAALVEINDLSTNDLKENGNGG